MLGVQVQKQLYLRNGTGYLYGESIESSEILRNICQLILHSCMHGHILCLAAVISRTTIKKTFPSIETITMVVLKCHMAS